MLPSKQSNPPDHSLELCRLPEIVLAVLVAIHIDIAPRLSLRYCFSLVSLGITQKCLCRLALNDALDSRNVPRRLLLSESLRTTRDRRSIRSMNVPSMYPNRQARPCCVPAIGSSILSSSPLLSQSTTCLNLRETPRLQYRGRALLCAVLDDFFGARRHLRLGLVGQA